MNARRDKTIGFRVSTEEKLMITQAAEAFQKTVSGFIRDIILGISGDVVKIRTLNFNNFNNHSSIQYKPVERLNPPPSMNVPNNFQEVTNDMGRGSVLDFRNCMDELKKVLKEKILV